MLKRFTAKDLILISVLAAIGIAIKPLINPTIKLISSPLMLPGGALAGGLYMMWMVLAVILINKSGVALLFGVVQAIVTLILGTFGNHGILSLLSYTLPGLLVEVAILLPFKREAWLRFLLFGALANAGGSLVMSLIIFKLPYVPLMIALGTSIASGALGGALAKILCIQLRKIEV